MDQQGTRSCSGSQCACRPRCACLHCGPAGRLKAWIVGVVFVVGGGYYLWTQHQAHVLQYWPLAIFLLCPLKHLFGGHGGHGGAGPQDHSQHQPGGPSHA
jgi:hypothetical protein